VDTMERKICLAAAENRTRTPQPSSPQPSGYTNRFFQNPLNMSFNIFGGPPKNMLAGSGP
jgi:hypothetical protein